MPWNGLEERIHGIGASETGTPVGKAVAVTTIWRRSSYGINGSLRCQC
ncbi:hypothetical protein PPBDW_I10042 [Photobacterium kishitanii]|nr:hypothetical protein PPBDW_I10042 [Photobacterium kishitanii]